MRYLPHTAEDIREMLEKIGLKTLDDLFEGIPESLRQNVDLKLPSPLSEWELDDHMANLAAENTGSRHPEYFLGAGSYQHHIPAIVPFLASRSEFQTAYTPYQPEVSQGTLQGIYEFQTMITQLLGMDVATASHYDGGTALAEAALISLRNHKTSDRIAVSKLIHPSHRAIMETYLRPTRFQAVEIPYDQNGKTDLSALEKMEDLAGICIQSPNFFGMIEDLGQIRSIADQKGALMTVGFTEALSYGLLKNPGYFNADLVTGEGQSLGLSQSFGGPGLGIIAGTKKQMRNLPGRLVGKTVDKLGRTGYVLTLATREQHIRREKASSNICSNNGLCAMTAAIYLATAGKIGIRRIAEQNYDNAAYLRNRLSEAGFTPLFDASFFNEFVMQVPEGFQEKREQLIQNHHIFAGLDLAAYYPEKKDCYLFCATETATKTAMDLLVKEVQP